MHFVDKTDNLLRSIRVSYGNSSVTKGFHFFELIWNPLFFCVQNAPFKATSSIYNPFWLHLLFFMHLLGFFSYMALKLKSTTNELWKGWHLARYHHFTRVACAKKSRGLRQKLDALRVQTGQSLSKYQGFGRKNSSVTSALHFFKFITTPYFFAFSMQHSRPRHQLSTLSGIIWYFSFIYWFVLRAKWLWNWKTLQNEMWKCWNLEWYHHFTRIACAKE